MSEEIKPDGYLVTWPGFAPHHFRIYGSWKEAAFFEAREHFDKDLDSNDVIAAKLADKNYRICPVKLVFLDEDKGAREV